MPARDVLLYENPYYGMPQAANPKRRRNPVNFKRVGKGTAKALFGGLRIEDLFGSIAGFAASAMLPTYLIRDPVDTEWKKAGKVALSLGIALVLKAAGDAIRPGMGRAMMYGGFAGTGAMALKIYAPTIPLIRSGPVVARPVGFPSGGTPMPAGVGRNTQEGFEPAQAY